MGIPSRISKFSSVASILFMGLGSAAVVIACGDDAEDLNLNVGTSTSDAGSNGGKKTVDASDIDASDSDAADGAIDPVENEVQTYSVLATVTGLTGGTLVLQNNGGDDVTVTADGPAVFATLLADTTGYSVTVKTQPAGQICDAKLASGTIAGAAVTNVTVTCQKGFKVGGTIQGLVGTGLVLKNNGGDTLNVGADATSFQHAGLLVTASPYDVSVFASPAEQRCEVTDETGSGTIANADYAGVEIVCVTNTYEVGGKVAGLVGNAQVTLQNNAAGDITQGNGAFSFGNRFVKGNPYDVKISAQPTAGGFQTQVCKAAGSSGVVSTNVEVDFTCATICGRADEGGNVELACPDGETIKTIDFASYGTPTGVCGAFAQGKVREEDEAMCHSAESANVATAACVGQASCSVRFSNDAPLGDPCSGTRKYTFVQATCGK